MAEVHEAIQSAFSRDHTLHVAWPRENNPFAKEAFAQPGTESDAYLYTFHEPIGRSKVYYRNNLPLEYIANFHLRIASKGQHETRVEVQTFGSEVIAGVSPLGFHGPANIYVRVEPTTIEEYEILLKIGAALNTPNMPPLIVPSN